MTYPERTPKWNSTKGYQGGTVIHNFVVRTSKFWSLLVNFIFCQLTYFGDLEGLVKVNVVCTKKMCRYLNYDEFDDADTIISNYYLSLSGD